jgi:ribonuclease J
MIQLIRPKYFMPIHGEYKMLMQHRQTAMDTGIPEENIFVCANGDILILRDHKVLPSNWRFQGDDIYVDGNDISGLSTAVLKDRKILSENGLVSVVVAIDSKNNELLASPVLVSRGFVFIKDSQGLMREATFVVQKALEETMKERTTFAEIKNCIRSSLEPFLFKKTHRNPIVIPVIINSKETMEALEQKRKKRS